MSEAPRRVLALVRNPVGGIRAYIRYTYGALDSARYRFTVLAVRTIESAQLNADLKGIAARVVEVDRPADLARAAISEARSDAHDLIHSHGLKSAAAASPAAWLSGLPHLVTSHDVFLPEQFAGARGALARVFLTVVLNRASAVHSVSPGADANLGAYLPRVAEARRRVVMNGIPPGPQDDVAEAAKWRSGLAPQGETLFGFFGRFMPQKGFEYIIDAADLLEKDERTRGRFRVAAVNDGSYIRELKAVVEKRGLSSRFAFTGFVPQARRLMSRVDAVLMPSLWEACGLVAMEALWAGAPLIATAVHGLGDVVRNTPTLVVRPQDAGGLAEAMRTVIMDREGSRRRAAAYAATARTRFDIQASAKGLEAIFDDLLLSSATRSAELSKSPERT